MIQQTSLDAYWHMTETNKIGSRQKLVIQALRELGTANNRQLSEYLNLPINTITPRVNELRKMHFITESHREVDPITERLVIQWRLCE